MHNREERGQAEDQDEEPGMISWGETRVKVVASGRERQRRGTARCRAGKLGHR